MAWHEDNTMDVEINDKIVRRSIERVDRFDSNPLRIHRMHGVVVTPRPVLLEGEELYERLGSDIPLIVKVR